jgi:hypothetical protein
MGRAGDGDRWAGQMCKRRSAVILLGGVFGLSGYWWLGPSRSPVATTMSVVMRWRRWRESSRRLVGEKPAQPISTTASTERRASGGGGSSSRSQT